MCAISEIKLHDHDCDDDFYDDDDDYDEYLDSISSYMPVARRYLGQEIIWPLPL